MRHPQVVSGSQRPHSTTPSGNPLYQWEEAYPDGSTRHFREIWVRAQGASGTVYGGIQVQEVQP